MVGVAVALLFSALGGALMIRLGDSLGFIDLPDGYLKSHDRPAVPLGGVGIFVGIHAAMAAEGMFDLGLFLASAIVFVLGLLDDRMDLSPKIRLAVEFGAGVALVLTATVPALPSGARGLVVGVLLIVVTINAVNLFDGLDGLAGSAALVTGLGIALLAASRDLGVVYGLIVAAALLGFLVWNWHPAKLFLGDNGAYAVAMFLVYGFVRASPKGSETMVLVASGLLGVFAIDLVVTLLRRRLSGKPLFAGDRSHVYDQLNDRGWRIPHIALLAAGAQAGIAITVVVVDAILSPPLAIVTLAVVLAAVVLALGRLGFLRPEAATTGH